MKPPLLPSEVLRRVVRVSRFDGISVLLVAGVCALISAAWRDVFGAVIGLLVAGAGAMELNGANMLRSGDPRGMRWLFRSHFQIGASMMVYIGVRLYTVNAEYVQKMVAEAEKSDDSMRQAIAQLRDQLQQTGMTLEQGMLTVVRLVCLSLAAATLLYQGGMTIYYKRRQAAVMAAVKEIDSQ